MATANSNSAIGDLIHRLLNEGCTYEQIADMFSDDQIPILLQHRYDGQIRNELKADEYSLSNSTKTYLRPVPQAVKELIYDYTGPDGLLNFKRTSKKNADSVNECDEPNRYEKKCQELPDNEDPCKHKDCHRRPVMGSDGFHDKCIAKCDSKKDGQFFLCGRYATRYLPHNYCTRKDGSQYDYFPNHDIPTDLVYCEYHYQEAVKESKQCFKDAQERLVYRNYNSPIDRNVIDNFRLPGYPRD